VECSARRPRQGPAADTHVPAAGSPPSSASTGLGPPQERGHAGERVANGQPCLDHTTRRTSAAPVRQGWLLLGGLGFWLSLLHCECPSRILRSECNQCRLGGSVPDISSKSPASVGLFGQRDCVQRLLPARFRTVALIHWEFSRLCRGGSRSLTFPGVCPGFPTEGTLMRAPPKQTPGRNVALVPPGVTARGWRVSG
jgi:hypothetical protein